MHQTLERSMNKKLENKLRHPFYLGFFTLCKKKKFIYSEEATRSEKISFFWLFWPSQKTLTLWFVFLLLNSYKLCQMHKLDKLSVAIPSIEVSGHVLDDRTEKQISIHLNFLFRAFPKWFHFGQVHLNFFRMLHLHLLASALSHFVFFKTEFPGQCHI